MMSLSAYLPQLESSDNTIIDLFSGAGIGASGFNGLYSIPQAYDINADACKSYSSNHAYTSVFCKDIRDINFSHHDFSGIIGLLATPPCQSFSDLNQSKDTTDDRANLVFEFIRALTEIRPDFALFENVYSIPKILKDRLVKDIEKLGYYVVSKTVKASDYGSLQIRRRWIISISTKKHIFPAPQINKRKSKSILQPTNTIAEIKPKAETLAKIQDISEIGKWVALPGQQFKVYFVVDPDGLLPAIVNPSKLRYIYPDKSRYLTFKELLAGFGVPDYKLVGNLSSRGQQLANGFPKELARAFATEFKKYHAS